MNIDMLLSRVASTDTGTKGVLSWRGEPFALSLEDPWNGNASFISCIPAGTYLCRRIVSPKFGDTFEVKNVQGRSHILFHKGNTHEDTSGCILVGEEFGILTGEPALLSSKKGYAEFQRLTAELDEFNLAIRDYWT